MRLSDRDRESGGGRTDLGPRWVLTSVLLFTVLYFSLFLALQILKLRCYDVTSHDMVEVPILWGDLSASLREGGTLPSMFLLGVLAQPLYVVVLLLYGLHKWLVWPVLYTVFFLSLALPALYLLCRVVLRDTLWSVLVTLSFALHPVTNLVALMGTRESPAFMAFFFLEVFAVRRRSYRMFLLFLVLANLARMNACVVNVIFGFVLLIAGPRRYGKTAVIVSVLIGATITGCLFWIGHESGESPISSNMVHLEAYGDSMGGVVRTLLTHPAAVLRKLWIPRNAGHLLQFTPVLFLPVFAPLYLLPCAVDLAYVLFTTPSIAGTVWMQNMTAALGEKARFHNNMSYVLPVMYVAAVFGLRRVLAWLNQGSPLRVLLAVLFVGVNLTFHYGEASLFGGPVPFSREFNWKYYGKTEHARVLDRAWESIPEGAGVVLQDSLVGLKATRAGRVFHLQYAKGDEPFDYVLADLYAFSYMMPRAEYLSRIKAFLGMPCLNVVRFEDGVIVMRRERATAWNGQILMFMEAHRDPLGRNLFNPYVFGDPPGEGSRSARVYSETQWVRP